MGDEKDILFELTSPFDYTVKGKGEKRTASFITLTAPTMKQHRSASRLKQSVMTLVRKDSLENEKTSSLKTIDPKEDSKEESEEESDEDSDITADLILTLLFCSNSIDINVVFDQAKALFIEGVALIDGEKNQKFNVHLIDQMSIDDFQNLVGEYIANFILA